MIPQARRPPAFPVEIEPASPTKPKSSSFSWTTKALPTTLFLPQFSVTIFSTKLMLAIP